MGKDLSELHLYDGFLFRMTFLDPEVCQDFLTALLGDRIGKIKSVRAEVSSQPEDVTKKGVRFDIVAEGSGEISVVEMQVIDQHNLLARTKVYGGHAAMLSAAKGDRTYSGVKKSFVIFICMFDPGTYGVPIYERVQMLQPVGFDTNYQRSWDDGSYLLLLNAVYDISCGNKTIEEFLDYVRTGELPESSGEPLVYRVAERVEEVKSSPKVRKEYSMYEEELREEGREEGRREGREEGKKEERQNIIMNMLETMTPEAVAKLAKVAIEEVLEVAASIAAQKPGSSLQQMHLQ